MATPDLGRLLLEAHRAISGDLSSSMSERGYPDIRPGHATLFVNIDRRSGTRLTELARRARVTKQAMMLLVDDLEQKGYVRRVSDPEDARAKVVRLTARGRRAAAETKRAVQAEDQYVRRLIGDRHTDTLQEALEWLVTRDNEEEEEDEG